MPIPKRLALAPLALAAIACGPTEAAGPRIALEEAYPLAYHHADCAPWDGPALALYFVGEPMSEPWAPADPSVRVSLYDVGPDLVGRTLEWTEQGGRMGYTQRCGRAGTCEPATSTLVEVTALDAEGRLSGNLQLRFADGTTIEGAFEAIRIDAQPLCG